jgi:protein TonB
LTRAGPKTSRRRLLRRKIEEFFILARDSRIFAALIAIAAVATAIAEPEYSPTPLYSPFSAETLAIRARAAAVFAPKPDYPFKARKERWAGVGWYVMHIVQKTGLVTSVEITQSSGHKILDRAAVDAFKRWRFKPGIRRAKCPETWSVPVQPKN